MDTPKERRSRRQADAIAKGKEEDLDHEMPMEIQNYIKEISSYSSFSRGSGAVMATRDWITSQLGIYTSSLLNRNDYRKHGGGSGSQMQRPRPRDYINARTERFSPRAQKRAAVLICLVPRANGELDVLLTKRSTRLRHHAGEVCFPGGKLEPGETDEQAALREANEEIALPGHLVAVCGYLPPRLSAHFLSVQPIVALVCPKFCPKPNPEEVAVSFEAPLKLFLGGPGSQHRAEDHVWQDFRFRVHYFDVKGHVVWGLTAGLLVDTAEAVYGKRARFEKWSPASSRPCDVAATVDRKLVYRPMSIQPKNSVATPQSGILNTTVDLGDDENLAAFPPRKAPRLDSDQADSLVRATIGDVEQGESIRKEEIVLNEGDCP